jgi:hypothetical protein
MHRGNRTVRCFLLVVAALAGAGITASVAGSLSFTDVKVKPPLTSDDGDKSTNISGISCMPPDDGRRICLVIDDQGKFAQAAALHGERLSGGGKIRMLRKSRRDEIVGAEPEGNCSKGADEFGDLDGEAVAYDGKDFYVSGSHGCSRKHNKFKPSSFVLARIPKILVAKALTEPDSIEDPSVRTTYRLSEALRLAPHVKEFFAQNLMKTADGAKANGLNIEGLLVSDGKLYAGLRAPVVAEQAYVIEAPVDPLFKKGAPLAEADIREHPLALGGRGIRDLAWVPDGRILVLGGPAQDDDVDFALYLVDPRDGWALTKIGVLGELPESADGTKAEALFVLGQDGSRLDVLVMFDGPKSGGPRIYTVK